MFKIDTAKCTGCGGCQELCPEVAISMLSNAMRIDQEKCKACTICFKVCPVRAIIEE